MMNKKLIIMIITIIVVLFLSTCSTTEIEKVPKSYEVIFMKPNGTYFKSVSENSVLDDPIVLSEDGRLAKWYRDSSLEHEWVFNVDEGYEGLILYGKWVESCKVTFHSNNETPSFSVSFEMGSYIDQPDIPKKEGYSFLGWFTDPDFQKEWSFNDTVVNDDVNLYAKWKILIYKVRFESNGGSRVPLQIFYKGMKKKPLQEPIKKGYDFKGWFTDLQLTNAFNLYSDEVDQDLTLYASWGLKQFNVTISHDNLIPDQNLRIGYDETLTGYYVPDIPGYSLEGIYLDSNYRSKLDLTEYRIDQNLHLYARWISPQSKLIQIIKKYSTEFPNAENDLQKWAIRNKRKEEIKDILQGAVITGWSGTIESLGTTTDGRAYLYVSISPKVTIGTWNNQLSDLFDDTLIPVESTLYKNLLGCSVGDRIIFSGVFFSSDEDFIRETSMTIKGAMNTPFFLFKFSSITVV